MILSLGQSRAVYVGILVRKSLKSWGNSGRLSLMDVLRNGERSKRGQRNRHVMGRVKTRLGILVSAGIPQANIWVLTHSQETAPSPQGLSVGRFALKKLRAILLPWNSNPPCSDPSAFRRGIPCLPIPPIGQKGILRLSACSMRAEDEWGATSPRCALCALAIQRTGPGLK
jgi:hypothetical protein